MQILPLSLGGVPALEGSQTFHLLSVRNARRVYISSILTTPAYDKTDLLLETLETWRPSTA